MSRRTPSLFREPDFVRLLAGQSVSELGSRVTLLALPLVAILGLGADAVQVGVLSAVEVSPFILIGLPAGAWADRLGRYRSILIVADVGRLCTLASVPIASGLGHLTLLQLYAVAFITGSFTVFFDVAYQSYLPVLVPRDQLVEGNATLEFTRSASDMAGPAAAGGLVAAIGGPAAVGVDAASFAVSVVSLLMIRSRERAVMRSGPAPSMIADIREGLGYVLRNPLLRPIAMCTSTWNFFGNMYAAMLILFCVRDLGMTPVAIGVALSIGAVSPTLGALLASRISRLLGVGRTIVLSASLGTSGLLVAFAPPAHPVPFVIAASCIGGVGVMYNIAQVSLRQAICPPHLRGRMNATMRFLVWGTIPLGSMAGGVIGATIGLQAAMVIGSLGTLLAVVPVALSPVRSLRTIEEAIPAV